MRDPNEIERILRRAEWRDWWRGVGRPTLMIAAGGAAAYFSLQLWPEVVAWIVLPIGAIGLPLTLWLGKQNR